MGELWTVTLGVVEYREAAALQERIRTARQADRIPDVLLLLEHPSVITRGRRPDPEGLPMGEEWYLSQGIDVVATDRGGKVTHHGPGQLVGYPIMRVTEVVRFVRTMEQAIVAALADVGITARARPEDGPDYTGVWVGEDKIASIGVHVAKGVTTHGFALNVRNDLQPFTYVVACGLPNVLMTSVVQQIGHAPERFEAVRAAAATRFAEAHDATVRAVGLDELSALLGA